MSTSIPCRGCAPPRLLPHLTLAPGRDGRLRLETSREATAPKQALTASRLFVERGGWFGAPALGSRLHEYRAAPLTEETARLVEQAAREALGSDAQISATIGREAIVLQIEGVPYAV